MIKSLPQETILKVDPTILEVLDALSPVTKGKASGLDRMTVRLLLAGFC